MKIQENHVVSMHYTLRNDAGEVVDSSQGRDPLDYIHGMGMIVPGLEKAMLGKAVNDKFNVVVSPAEGYGDYDARMVQEIPLEAFQGAEVEPGMQFMARGPQGQTVITITAVKGEVAVADGNHPLAGKNLNFEIEVTGIREATTEELENGLGGGCCGGDCDCGDECDCSDDDEHECCGGKGHDDGSECCGGKGHADGSECCGGKGHGHDDGHECCGGKGHQ